MSSNTAYSLKIHIYPNHFAVHLKLMCYCKSIILKTSKRYTVPRVHETFQKFHLQDEVKTQWHRQPFPMSPKPLASALPTELNFLPVLVPCLAICCPLCLPYFFTCKFLRKVQSKRQLPHEAFPSLSTLFVTPSCYYHCFFL